MSLLRNTCWRAVGLVFLLVGFVGVAGAAVVHEATWSNGCTQDGMQDVETYSSSDGSTVGFTRSGSSTSNGCSISGSATSGSGYLALSVNDDTAAGTESKGYGGSATILLESEYSGITVNTPANTPDTIIPMSISFDLNGTVSGDQFVIGGLAGAFSSELKINAIISGGEDGVVILSEQFEVGSSVGTCPPTSCFANVDGTYSTSVFDFDTAKTLNITLELFGTVSTTTFFSSLAHANISSSSLSFSESNAFNLPQGFVVNFPEAGIINNNWVPPSPVPVPAALWLFASGVVALYGRSSRFRQTATK